MYTSAAYAILIEDTFDKIRELGRLKGGEYSGDDDRLANFRRNAERLGLTKEAVWAVYANKHWDAVMQFIKDEQAGVARDRMEPLSGRIDDLIVYLLLFKAMLDERAVKEFDGYKNMPISEIMRKRTEELSQYKIPGTM